MNELVLMARNHSEMLELLQHLHLEVKQEKKKPSSVSYLITYLSSDQLFCSSIKIPNERNTHEVIIIWEHSGAEDGRSGNIYKIEMLDKTLHRVYQAYNI